MIFLNNYTPLLTHGVAGVGRFKRTYTPPNFASRRGIGNLYLLSIYFYFIRVYVLCEFTQLHPLIGRTAEHSHVPNQLRLNTHQPDHRYLGPVY